MWKFYHASPTSNREAISREGLRGGDHPRLWEDSTWQPRGNYLFEHAPNARDYARLLIQRLEIETVDVWRVDLTGLRPMWDPESWVQAGQRPLDTTLMHLNYPSRWYVPESLPPSRLRLGRCVRRGHGRRRQTFRAPLPDGLQYVDLQAEDYPLVLRDLGRERPARRWERGLAVAA